MTYSDPMISPTFSNSLTFASHTYTMSEVDLGHVVAINVVYIYNYIYF